MLGRGSCLWKGPSPLWLQERQRQRGVGWGGLGDSPLPSPELTPPLTPSPNLNAQNNPEDQTAGWRGLCWVPCSSWSSSVRTGVGHTHGTRTQGTGQRQGAEKEAEARNLVPRLSMWFGRRGDHRASETDAEAKEAPSPVPAVSPRDPVPRWR